MADTKNIWMGRFIIVAIITVFSFFISTFIAQVQNDKNKTQSPADASERTKEYQKLGMWGGLMVSMVWLLYVAGKDQRSIEKTKTLQNIVYESVESATSPVLTIKSSGLASGPPSAPSSAASSMGRGFGSGTEMQMLKRPGPTSAFATKSTQ